MLVLKKNIVWLAMMLLAGTAMASPINLNPDATDAMAPNIAVYGNNIAVMWAADEYNNRYPQNMYSAYSENGGATFGAFSTFAQNNPSSSYRNTMPNLIYDANGSLNMVWCVWSDTVGPTYSGSSDYGATWSTAVNTGGGKYPRNYGIGFAVNGQNFQTINYDAGTRHVWTNKSTDGGTTWIATDLTGTAGYITTGTSYLSSAVYNSSGNYFSVAYNNSKLVVLSEVDGSWSSTELTDQDTSISLANEHAIASYGDDIFIVYSLYGNVYFRQSSDNGSTWMDAVQVDGADTGEQIAPVLALDADGGYYVSWQDNRNGTDQIYYASSTDGVTWTEQAVWASELAQTSPDMVVNGDTPQLVWVEDGSPMYMVIPEPASFAVLGFVAAVACLKRKSVRRS